MKEKQGATGAYNGADLAPGVFLKEMMLKVTSKGSVSYNR